MGYLFDVLIPALIILAVAFIWFRSLLSKFIPPVQRGDRRIDVHPRSLASSGGFQRDAQVTESATRNVPAERRWEGYEPVDDVEKPRPRRQERQSAGSGLMRRHRRGQASPQGQMLAQALHDPESVRTAFLVKEVLDAPVGMRRP